MTFVHIYLDRKLHLLLLRVSSLVSNHQTTITETIRRVLYSHICSRTAFYKPLEKRLSPQKGLYFNSCAILLYSRTSIIRPPLGSSPWIGVRIREMFRIRRMSTCAHYMYLISKVVENYDLSCPSRTSTRLHIHHTSNANITSMMF